MDPVQVELQRYIEVRDRLQTELQDKEEELNTLLGQLRVFENEFLRSVDPFQQCLARWTHRCKVVEHVIDRLEEQHELPHTVGAWYQEIEEELHPPLPEPTPEPLPILTPEESKEAKELYRSLARRFHPDLVQSEALQEKRKAMMAQINDSYQRNDLDNLRALVHSPDVHNQEEERKGDVWTRLVLEIAMLRKSITKKEEEIRSARTSELANFMYDLDVESPHCFDAVIVLLKNKIRIQKERWRQLRVREEHFWLERDE